MRRLDLARSPARCTLPPSQLRAVGNVTTPPPPPPRKTKEQKKKKYRNHWQKVRRRYYHSTIIRLYCCSVGTTPLCCRKKTRVLCETDTTQLHTHTHLYAVSGLIVCTTRRWTSTAISRAVYDANALPQHVTSLLWHARVIHTGWSYFFTGRYRPMRSHVYCVQLFCLTKRLKPHGHRDWAKKSCLKRLWDREREFYWKKFMTDKNVCLLRNTIVHVYIDVACRYFRKITYVNFS